MLSAAIYSAVEGYTDAASIKSNQTVTTTTKTISATSSNAKETVEKLLVNEASVAQE